MGIGLDPAGKIRHARILRTDADHPRRSRPTDSEISNGFRRLNDPSAFGLAGGYGGGGKKVQKTATNIAA